MNGIRRNRNNMADKRKIGHIKTNLDNATPEQRERLMNNVVEAYKWLYRSVVERKIREMLKRP